MIIQTKTDIDVLSARIIDGVNKGLRKLVETTAAQGGSLVVSDGKGNPSLVPAKELLKTLPKQES
jgi:hypothetical protein